MTPRSVSLDQGRRVMEAGASIRGSHPRVVTGTADATVLPSVSPAAHLLRREGFTDLSRFAVRDRSRTGQCHLPDKEFRSVVPNRFRKGWTLS